MRLLPAATTLHVIVALGLTIVAARTPDKSLVLLFCLCLLFSQAGLLAVWSLSSRATRDCRIAGVCAGVGLLMAEVFFAAKISLPMSILLTTLAFAGAAAPLYFVPGLRLRLISEGEARSAQQLQFSIREILTFTAVVALLLAAGRLIESANRTLPSRGPLLQLLIEDDYLVDMATFSVCSVFVGWGSFWLLLGPGTRWLRWPLLPLVPVGAGMIPVLYRMGHEWWIFIFASFVMELIIGATLVTAWLRGYRLVGLGDPDIK